MTVAHARKLDDEFLELASHLRQVKQTNPKGFKKLYYMPQLGRRKAYYLVSIDKAFGNKNVPAERLKKIGWTNSPCSPRLSPMKTWRMRCSLPS